MNSQLFRVLGAPAFPSKVGQPDAERQSCALATAYSCWGGSWLENDLSWVPSCYVFCWLHLGMKHCFIMFFNCCAKLCLGSMDDGSVWSTLQNTQIKVAATAEWMLHCWRFERFWAITSEICWSLHGWLDLIHAPCVGIISYGISPPYFSMSFFFNDSFIVHSVIEVTRAAWTARALQIAPDCPTAARGNSTCKTSSLRPTVYVYLEALPKI